MYAFFLVLTVLVSNQTPVKFYHTSNARFSSFDSCISKGVETGDALLAKFDRYRKKPNVKAEVSCQVHPTTEAASSFPRARDFAKRQRGVTPSE